MQSPYQATINGDFFHVSFPQRDPKFRFLLSQIKLIDERNWNDEKKYWSLKISIQSLNFVLTNGFQLIGPNDVRRLAQIGPDLIRKEENRRVKVGLATATDAPVIPEIASKMLLPAYPYQWVPVHYALLSDWNFLLADEMACGKSVESLMIAQHPHLAHKKVIIVTKAPETFRNELMKFFGEYGHIIDGPLSYEIPGVRFYICSYHRLKHLFHDPSLYQPYQWTKDCFYIFDEAQFIKNEKTKTHQFAAALVKDVQEKIFMTGTPIMNREEELYTILKLMIKGFMSKSRFMQKFCGYQWTPEGMVQGERSLAKLHEFLYQNCFVRREKLQVQPQLPEKTRTSVKLQEDLTAIHGKSALELFSKSAQLKAKSKEFKDYFEMVFDAAPKVGVFAHHKIVLDSLEQICITAKIRYVRIDGSSGDRQALCTLFANDPSIKVALLGMQVAGTGLNDLQAANLCVFAEFPWTPGLLLQAEDRFWRPGLKNPLLVIYTLFTTFEERLAAIWLSKLGTIRRVTRHQAIPDSHTDIDLMRELAAEFNIPLE